MAANFSECELYGGSSGAQKVKTLSSKEKQSFYANFRKRVTPGIEEIRSEQRKGFEDNKNLTVA